MYDQDSRMTLLQKSGGRVRLNSPPHKQHQFTTVEIRKFYDMMKSELFPIYYKFAERLYIGQADMRQDGAPPIGVVLLERCIRSLLKKQIHHR